MKRGLELDRVVLLGRTFEEYARYFALDEASLRRRRILDVASGVSSFCAEANERGLGVTALDRIYSVPADDLVEKCRTDLDHIVQAVAGLPVYSWTFYKTPERMRQFRERAYRRFLEDYRSHGKKRYIAGLLPNLPFADGTFHLTLVSYLLFVYEDQLSYDFHQYSIREIMRVTSGELRVYPVVTFEAERSKYVDRLINDPGLSHLQFEIVPTDFEFLKNSNAFLRVTHRGR